ncbi:hypothetical protein K402DRAFT_391478 [Aulographum hederae CBS 113979]|uniref:Uncharacterized protein n=1 Tax=Aulographum hederae CBS 113979 TaxID=1176131 RepID=A0A6G1H701_9PEZI|nr:hypothetical protein K402DRAFT_391478 [Aulographum hederae CBS 113979]
MSNHYIQSDPHTYLPIQTKPKPNSYKLPKQPRPGPSLPSSNPHIKPQKPTPSPRSDHLLIRQLLAKPAHRHRHLKQPRDRRRYRGPGLQRGRGGEGVDLMQGAAARESGGERGRCEGLAVGCRSRCLGWGGDWERGPGAEEGRGGEVGGILYSVIVGLNA